MRGKGYSWVVPVCLHWHSSRLCLWSNQTLWQIFMESSEGTGFVYVLPDACVFRASLLCFALLSSHFQVKPTP